LPKGIPSHDTFRRVFMYMNPESFGKAFMSWTSSLRETIKGEIIPIDGKCLRGSKDSFHKKTAIHMVSAWSESNQLVPQFLSDIIIFSHLDFHLQGLAIHLL
jgi:hypothetical protein